MKTELVLRLPSVLYTNDVSDLLLKEFAAFVGEITKENYIFLSPTESVIIETTPIMSQQLPPDINLISLKIEGASRFVEVKNRSLFRSFQEISDKSLNQVVIQGDNPVSVRGLHSKLALTLGSHKFIFRTLFYKYALMWFWLTLVLIWFAEYRGAKLIHAGLSLRTPLSALGAILLAAIGLGTSLLYANFLVPFFSYWFPYFEIEGNVSSHRTAFQKFWSAIFASLFAAGLLNLLFLLRS